jgi:hypothetical protein
MDRRHAVTHQLDLSCADVEELTGLFVLDALATGEADAVRRHLVAHPDGHPSVADLAATTSALAMLAEPAEAPIGLRARVLAAVAVTPQVPSVAGVGGLAGAPQLARSTESRAAGGGPAAPTTRPFSLDVARRGRPTPWARSILAAAAVVAIVLLAGWNVLLQRQASDAAGRAAVLGSAIAQAADPTSRVARLAGSGSAAAARGFAVFPVEGAGTIVLDGLPPAETGRTYQAWVLAGGQPISAGLMNVGSDGLAILADVIPVSGTDTVALTLEPAGGSPGPTTDPVVVGQLPVPLALGLHG